MTKSNDKELNIPKMQNIQSEDEALMEFCASELTMGTATGTYFEGGYAPWYVYP
ncbi:burhizin family lasso peptide [Mycoavidus sp. SF9855]|uniref:burhizin family lasso peptide n=1 Tax=Mycoavidus sp. SF9855 TaxID=2968475 RepID=UPI00211C87C6|nr:burhizin family lasso peptide [Mycoavidus sp. SF9855]UUM20740.1 hypothetical protein NQD60_04440 [Mycoavidus sp. SF9855]